MLGRHNATRLALMIRSPAGEFKTRQAATTTLFRFSSTVSAGRHRDGSSVPPVGPFAPLKVSRGRYTFSEYSPLARVTPRLNRDYKSCHGDNRACSAGVPAG